MTESTRKTFSPPAFRPPRWWAVTAAVVLGACGMIGQILLWRELLALYQGNELTTGIILANWLLAEAGGAWVFGRGAQTGRYPFFLFAVMNGLYAAVLLGSLILIRLLRPWLGIAIGEPLGPVFTMVSSLLVLAPASFLHGALFPTTSHLFLEGQLQPASRVVGRLYVFESAGALLGALAWMAYSYTGGHSFRPAVTVSVLTVLVLLLRKQFSRSAPKFFYRTVVLLGTSWALFGLWHASDAIHTWSLARQYRPYRVLGALSSPYGNWVVLDANEQLLFVADGWPAYLLPVPDRVAVEELAHLPLLAHDQPRRLCIIGGGVGGLLNEVLKHPFIETVDYTETDPAVFDLLRQFPTDLTTKELGDRRVRIHLCDGRRFLLQSGDVFDVIWVNAFEPATLQANRYYTMEFFGMLRRQLADDGIVLVTLPGRVAYPSHDLRLLQAGLLQLLHQAIGHVRLLPGEGQFIYVASPQRDLANITADDLLLRAQERGIQGSIGTFRHLEQRLHPGWQSWATNEYREVRPPINRDLRPVAVFHLLAHHQSTYTPLARGYVQALWQGLWMLIVAGIACWFAFRSCRWPWGRETAAVSPVFLQVATTGFAGMLLNLLLILALQSALGHVQMWIGLLMAAFMVGAAGTAFLATRWPLPSHRLSLALRLCDMVLCAYCALLPWALLGIVNILAPRVEIGAVMLLAFLNAIAGGLTGILFPLSAAYRTRQDNNAGRTAGLLQTADLLGGWLAGLWGSPFLIPLGGVFGTCMLILAMKGLSLLLMHSTIKARS